MIWVQKYGKRYNSLKTNVINIGQSFILYCCRKCKLIVYNFQKHSLKLIKTQYEIEQKHSISVAKTNIFNF